MTEDGTYFIALPVDKYYIKLSNDMHAGSINILMMKSRSIFSMTKYRKFVYLHCRKKVPLAFYF